MNFRNSLYVFLFVIILAISIFLHKRTGNHLVDKINTTSQHHDAEVFIPKGHVLIPVELVNSEAIGQLLGGFGYINLYTSDTGAAAELILPNVRLLQAPLNPAVYAVLLKESDAQHVMNHPGPYRAVLLGKEKISAKNISKKTMSKKHEIPFEKKIGQAPKKNIQPNIEVDYEQDLSYE